MGYKLWRAGPDWTYLMQAYLEGGACSVPCPAVRANLVASGLMVAASPAPSRRGDSPRTTLALTKAGQRRAEQLRAQQLTVRQHQWHRLQLHIALSKR